MCDMKSATLTLEEHFKEVFCIFKMPARAFKKFHKAYTGDDVNNDDLQEARLLIVKMLLKTLYDDCEVVLDEIKKERG